MSDNYKDYLEEMYDGGNIVQVYKQMKDDEEKAKEIVKTVQEIQEKAKREEKERIQNTMDVTEDEINKVFDDYGVEDKYAEYLVDGATLTCNQVLLSSYTLSEEKDGKEKIIDFRARVNESSAQLEQRKYGNLHVSENPISANGLTYATVSDTVKAGDIEEAANIFPFRCHCIIGPPDREDELKNILSDPAAGMQGVCRHLMRLNPEWENIPLKASNDTSSEVTGYMRLGEINCIDAKNVESENPDYLQSVREGKIKDVTLVSEKDGITMTSILFCKHGGIIFPVTSGQTDSDIMNNALYNMERYLAGELSEDEVEFYMKRVEQNCNLAMGKMDNSQLSGQNSESDFDKYIKAWSYYWNRKIEEGVFGDNLVLVRPDVVKAMIRGESSWGTDGDLNGTRDVMQALVPGDYGLWILSGCDPTDVNKSHIKDGKSKVWVKDGIEYDSMSIVPSFNYWYNEDAGRTNTDYYGFGEGLNILKDNVITIIEDSNGNPSVLNNSVGEYLIHYDKVTVNMGIACGIGYLASNMNMCGSEKDGVAAYNGGGAEAKHGTPYTQVIDDYLKCIKDNEGNQVEPLKD